ncbi:MAG: ATP-dependent DNA helicase [Candidatus Nanopelagicales bacterium]
MNDVTAAVGGLALDEGQRRLVVATGSTMLLGPAGTGKSTALVAATAHLAARRERVVAIAADRAAAREWQGRLARLVAGVAPAVTTLASFSADLVAGLGVAADPDDGPRLLTAPEQEARVRELLTGSLTESPGRAVDWPAEWKPALGTRAFARLLRRCLAQARRTGWDPEDLRREATAVGDRGWIAVADFLAEYLDVLDWEGAVDYAELGVRALAVARADPGGWTVVLDDAQTLDPVQARLVTALTANGGLLIAAGDPDQSVTSYRGADLTALADLCAGCEVLVADRVYRGGAGARDARSRLLGTRWYPGLPVALGRRYRMPAVVSPGGADEVTVQEYDDPVAQAHHIADRLRAAHREGSAWCEMAVLVTSPATEWGPLVQGLGQAHIPVHVPVADLPLAAQPAVATLLTLVDLVLDPDRCDDQATWEQLACSDLMLVPARDWRAAVRVADRHGVPVTALVTDPVLVADHPVAAPAVEALGALRSRIERAREAYQGAATPAEVLWWLWHGTDGVWPERLRRRAAGTGDRAISAARDLDSVIQLFRLAERAPERWGGRRGLRALIDEIEHQEIPAEPDQKASSYSDSVTLMSLHRAPGRVWPLVVVTGLSESSWSAAETLGLLDPGQLTGECLLPVPPRRAAAERRRLLNLALGRASHRLLLCSAGGADDPPTPLLEQAGLPVQRVRGLPATPQTPLDTLLRARREVSLAGPDARSALGAVRRLVTTASGDPLLPGGDPRRWPGVSDWTVGPCELRPAGRPLAVSASALSLLDECPLRWLFQRELRGDGEPGPAAGLGLIVHEAAALMVTEPGSDPTEVLERVWQPLAFDADWQAAAERQVALSAVTRAAAWLAGRSGRLLPEYELDREMATSSGERLVLRGAVDLIEVHDDHLLVWDHKTRRSPMSIADAARNVQLAVYQQAVADALGLRAAGAGLVQLCVPAGTREPDQPKVRVQPPATELQDWFPQVLDDAVTAVRSERFVPRPGAHCRTCAFRPTCPAQGGAL